RDLCTVLHFIGAVTTDIYTLSYTTLFRSGGIADGRGLAAALMLGADGVLVGTRFWASEEALAPKVATDRAMKATGDDTVRSKAIDRKSTRLNSSHLGISYAVFCLKKKKKH